MPGRLPVLLALVAVASGAARAQAAYRFDTFGTDRGLSQSTVTALAQDAQGYLWIGTDDGLNRFDGRTFTVYRHALEDSSTLPSSRVTSLWVDRAGELWVGTMGGLARLDRRTETFHIPLGAPGDPASPCTPDVTALAPAADGALWAGTFSGGLCRIAPDRRSARRVVIGPSPEAPDGTTSTDRVYGLDRALDGSLWARVSLYRTSQSPTCRIEGDTCRFQDDRQLRRPIPGTDLLVALGTTQALGLARRAPGGRLRRLPEPRLPSGTLPAPLQELVAVPDGNVWVGTEQQGILVIDPATGCSRALVPVPADPRSLPSATVRALFRDRQGTVWVGTTQGLVRWQPPEAGRFQVLQSGPPGIGLSDARVTGILEARDGRVYVGTRDGLNVLDPATGRVDVLRRPNDGAYPNAFWHLWEDPEGGIWMGSKRRGLLRLDADSRQIRRVDLFDGAGLLPVQTEQLQVRHVGGDRQGRVWVATSYGFTVRTADGAWHPFPIGPRDYPLPTGRVNVFYEDWGGTVWAGTDAGLCRLRPEADVPDDLAFQCYHTRAGDPATLGADVVWSLAEDGRGRLWAGTVGGGLARYDRQRDAFVRLTTRDGLPNNTVYALVGDRRGDLWATTNAGLARIDLDGRVTTFTTADGLPGDEFDFMAAHVGPSGTVYVGGPSGVAWFDPDRLAERTAPPPVAITAVEVFGREHPGLFADGDTLRLGHDENSFQLTVSTLDLRTPERGRYRYRLAGYEDAWREVGAADAEASYTRVPAGRYAFEVAGTGADGRFSDDVTRLHVVVVPAVWQTAWFRGGLLALVVAVSLGAVLGVLRRRRDASARRAADVAELKRRVAEGRERERIRLARDLHDGPVQDLYRIGHDLDRLRLQGAAGGSLGEARQRVTAVTSTLRDVLAALRPPIIPHLGLPAALEALARRDRDLDVTLDLDEDAARALSDDAKNAVYRIVQEALANVAKHAGATSATVTLARLARGVEVVVRDAGRGFEPPPHLLDFARAGRFGVVGASERAEVLDGWFRVESAPGEGTTVRAWLPLDAAVVGEA